MQFRCIFHYKHRSENYLFKIVEAIFSFGCCTFLIFKLCVETKGIGLDSVSLFCNAHGKIYNCIGNPGAFNTAVVMFVTALFLVYGLFAVYSIVWASFHCMHPLKSLLEDKKIHLSRDFRFLLNLLCLGSGIAPAITTLTILEKVYIQQVLCFISTKAFLGSIRCIETNEN